ncbi:FUSC family protein [Petropleomorpha daqingensis]|uniref:Integral membrane bound transporter domain-containing protein n=1 Tax=Petropleomorpha daqingensis TaxID=2026353 RepID=A0A853CM76_9ACTN|nr:FUSC family protein [Petropleomorpha daqingensis]NYJ07919.1 hypothetical protein [Petropleomorpha daqingensis]
MSRPGLTDVRPEHRLATIFEIHAAGLTLRRGIAAVVILGAVFAALHALDLEAYELSVLFGLLFVAVSDPGGAYLVRAREMALVGGAGTLLTALGFAAGGWPWGLAVLIVFAVTVLCGLAVCLGVHRFIGALLLNIWLLVALGTAVFDAHHGTPLHPWPQALAWLTASALWLAATCLLWLARGRKAETSPFPELPGDVSPRPLTRQVAIFAALRAVLVAGAVAIALGLHLPNASWLPVATIITLKPDIEQSKLIAEQRLAGAILGAGLACLVLLTIDNRYAVEAVLVVLAAVAASIRFVNYALYCAAVAATTLIAIDLPHPDTLAAEGERVLYTLVGVAIGVAGMLLADLLGRRAAGSAPQHAGRAAAG